MSVLVAPGKTAPRICHDYSLFDPIRGSPNIITDTPPIKGDGIAPVAPPIGSCRHDYTTKTPQSVLPPMDVRPDDTTRYKLATVCKKCRIHSDIELDYRGCRIACPNSEYPLHHFQRLDQEDLITAERIRYTWRCSAPHCCALLHISYRLPRISDKEKELLTDPELLKQRYEVLVQRDPTREGVQQVSSTDSLNRLRIYIRDALNPEHTRKSFPANNKRFMEAFGWMGSDCEDILERLGFKYTDANWSLPDPPIIDDRLETDSNSQRQFLEDVGYELSAWIHTLAASGSGFVNHVAKDGWPSAARDVERILAEQGYARYMSSARGPLPTDEIQYLASLGALPDFADSLIEFAYERQTSCDPQNTPYYFECLQVITHGRQTESLQLKVATLQSQDVVSRRDLFAAYRHLGIGTARAANISDEEVLATFQARQSDLGPSAAEEARQALNRIGTARQSQRLIRASQQSVDTYEDAIAWLGNGVTTDTADEAIVAVFAIRVGDNATDIEIGRKAISAIAKARQSKMLDSWLITGQTESPTMNVDEALRHLNIEQNLHDIDQTILPILFENARADRPGDLTNRAIATIQQALAESNTAPSHTSDTWPVGLTSHGNTCYLNSLLQYYFSIAPLRNIILNYDNYKLDTSRYEDVEGAKKSERVGGLQVTPVEIKGGQRFAEDLKHLFERMVKDPDSAVKPEEDLVCRAFLHPRDYALLASSIRDQAAETNGVVEDAVEDPMEEPLIDLTGDSAGSSTTLQGSTDGAEFDQSMKDGDPLTPPASPGQPPKDENVEPEHAPPLPPRRFTSTKEEALSKAQEKARQQQDVTEVHDAIMFRLRSGMTPQGVDSEEQVDAIRDLFSIRMAETTVHNGVLGKSKPVTDVTIQLNVPSEPVDIYSALDNFFDPQPVAEKPEFESFRSIETLPPVLQISIPRIGYGSNGTYKSTESVKLENELFVDRYMANKEILPRREACWGWRKQLHDLQREQKMHAPDATGLGGPTSMTESSNFLNSLSGTNELLEEIGVEGIPLQDSLSPTISSQANGQSERVADLDRQIVGLRRQLAGQFDDLKDIKYRLAAVFIHRGNSGHGHYWIYIHDFTNDMWRSYNDEKVEEHKKLEDILEAKEWTQGTPTYAVYVKDDLKEQYVQPVCRAPEKAPTPEPWPTNEWANNQQSNDVQMTSDSQMESQTTGTVNPTTVTEGGQASWDEERQVAGSNKW